MFTKEQIELLEVIANDGSFAGEDQILIRGILAMCSEINKKSKPQIIVVIEGGNFQYGTANMDIELVVADLDNIENGGDLYYPCLAGESQADFDDVVQKRYEDVIIARAKNLPKETRIFIHDSKDAFPYNVAVDGDVLATYKTFDEANKFLQAFLRSIPRC